MAKKTGEVQQEAVPTYTLRADNRFHLNTLVKMKWLALEKSPAHQEIAAELDAKLLEFEQYERAHREPAQ